MIRTKSELRLYLNEDAKANHIRPGISYLCKLLYGNVNACVFRYLKSLRKLLKTADIKEFIRLKTIKLIDNQKVVKRDAHMLNLAHIMFSDSLPLGIVNAINMWYYDLNRFLKAA